MSVKVSICSSAIRVKDWQKFYDCVADTKIPFEIVFAGPKSPTFKLPDNFRFIHTPVKPAQCYHLTYLNARGQVIMSTADDAEYGANAIDLAYDFFMRKENRLLMSGFRQFEDGTETTEVHHYVDEDGKRIIASPFPVFFRETYFRLGGADRRYITGQWENDFSFRLLNAGGSIEICMDAIIRVKHREKHEDGSKVRDYWPGESKLLADTWFYPDRRFRRIPTSPLEPYGEGNLITQSQGNKGEWP